MPPEPDRYTKYKAMLKARLLQQGQAIPWEEQDTRARSAARAHADMADSEEYMPEEVKAVTPAEEKAVAPGPAGPPVNFNEAMRVPRWRQAFFSWARQDQIAGESCTFIDAVENYRVTPTWATLYQILGQYITADAENPVNIPAEILHPLRDITGTTLAARQGTPAPRGDVFDAAYDSLRTMLSDQYSNFRLRYRR